MRESTDVDGLRKIKIVLNCENKEYEISSLMKDDEIIILKEKQKD